MRTVALKLDEDEIQMVANLAEYTHSMEVYANKHIQSSYNLYLNETCAIALKLARIFRATEKRFPRVAVAVSPGQGKSELSGRADMLEAWAKKDPEFPAYLLSNEGFHSWIFSISVIHSKCMRLLGSKARTVVMWSSREFEFTPQHIIWGQYLPHIWKIRNPEVLTEQDTNSNVISLIADIRKSQYLMLYGSSAEFLSRMTSFLENARRIARDNNAVFDKFTGDGFLVHFSEAISGPSKSTIAEDFCAFSAQMLAFSKEFFFSWSGVLSRLPSETIGLAIGADIGDISFQLTEGELIAVGEPVVWASRMADVADAGEIIANNKLSRFLEGHPGLVQTEVVRELKGSGATRAFALNLSERAVKPKVTRKRIWRQSATSNYWKK